MAAWRITKINNATHEVEMQAPSGETIITVVPEGHRDLAKHKAYLQSLIDQHEAAVPAAPEITPAIVIEAKAVRRLHIDYRLGLIIVLLIYILKLKLG